MYIYVCVCLNKKTYVHRIPLKRFSLIYVNVIWEENLTPLNIRILHAARIPKRMFIQDASLSRQP